jgi:hypothetical protein
MAFAKLSQTIFKGIVDAEANLNKTINKVYKNVNEIKDIDLCNILEYIANQVGTAAISNNKTINDVKTLARTLDNFINTFEKTYPLTTPLIQAKQIQDVVDSLNSIPTIESNVIPQGPKINNLFKAAADKLTPFTDSKNLTPRSINTVINLVKSIRGTLQAVASIASPADLLGLLNVKLDLSKLQKFVDPAKLIPFLTVLLNLLRGISNVIQVIINFLQSIKNIVNLLKTIVKVINGVILAIYAVTAVLPTMFLTAGVVLGFEKILKTIQKTILDPLTAVLTEIDNGLALIIGILTTVQNFLTKIISILLDIINQLQNCKDLSVSTLLYDFRNTIGSLLGNLRDIDSAIFDFTAGNTDPGINDALNQRYNDLGGNTSASDALIKNILLNDSQFNNQNPVLQVLLDQNPGKSLNEVLLGQFGFNNSNALLDPSSNNLNGVKTNTDGLTGNGIGGALTPTTIPGGNGGNNGLSFDSSGYNLNDLNRLNRLGLGNLNKDSTFGQTGDRNVNNLNNLKRQDLLDIINRLQKDKRNQTELNSLTRYYKGLILKIIVEEIVDNGITLKRRYGIALNNKSILVTSTDPTYATNIEVIFNELVFRIDIGKLGEQNDSSTNDQINNLGIGNVSQANNYTIQNSTMADIKNQITQIPALKNILTTTTKKLAISITQRDRIVKTLLSIGYTKTEITDLLRNKGYSVENLV